MCRFSPSREITEGHPEGNCIVIIYKYNRYVKKRIDESLVKVAVNG